MSKKEYFKKMIEEEELSIQDVYEKDEEFFLKEISFIIESLKLKNGDYPYGSISNIADILQKTEKGKILIVKKIVEGMHLYRFLYKYGFLKIENFFKENAILISSIINYDDIDDKEIEKILIENDTGLNFIKSFSLDYLIKSLDVVTVEEAIRSLMAQNDLSWKKRKKCFFYLRLLDAAETTDNHEIRSIIYSLSPKEVYSAIIDYSKSKIKEEG